MKIYEIGTGYTPIPAKIGAATEIIVEQLTRSFIKNGKSAEIIDIKAGSREKTDLPINEVYVPKFFTKTDVSLGVVHKLKRVIYSIFLANKLKKIIKNSNGKIVLHFHNQYNSYFFLKLVPKKVRKDVLIAYTVHSYIWGTKWEEIENTIKRKYFQEVYCVKNADVVFVLNDITVDHFTSKLGVKKERIFKILNGVNTEEYIPIEPERKNQLKALYGLETKKIILQVGSVCERKNQLGSVQMLSEYLNKNKDIVYLYAGGIIDEEYQGKIKQFAIDNDISEQVRYLGEVPPGQKLNELFNIAECSVFTSTLESFGLVIIESISAGTPVVLGNNLMFELRNGYYIYSTKEEFITHIDDLINKRKSTLCERDDFFQMYSWDSVARLHSEIFK